MSRIQKLLSKQAALKASLDSVLETEGNGEALSTEDSEKVDRWYAEFQQLEEERKTLEKLEKMKTGLSDDGGF